MAENSIRYTVAFTNLKETLRALKEFPALKRQALRRGLFGIAEEIMTDSKEICPVDTGALKSTGHVQLPKVDGAKISVTLGYGGPAGPGVGVGRTGRKPPSEVGYAWEVHESVGKHFHGNGQAKFLEMPLNARLPKMDRELAEEIEELARRVFK